MFNNGFEIRESLEKDVPLILSFIKELADYEGLLHEVVATEDIIHKSIFEEKTAKVVIAEYDGIAIGFALYFNNFSTFLGRPGIYLEDLYIRPEMRGRGYGKRIISYLASICEENNYGRLEWWCLDENTPSVDFYKSIGAKPMDEWTVFRLSEKSLTKMARNF